MRIGIGSLLVFGLTLAGCGGGGSGDGGGGGGGGDSLAPSVPGGIAATPVSPTAIDISWQAAADNVAVTGYRIYRNNMFLRIAAATAASDTNLVTGVSYCYEISAVDAAGNESARSSAQCATPHNVWTSRTPHADITVRAIIHDGTRYVAVGDPASASYVLTSPDGHAWTAHATSQAVILGLEDIVWTGAQYIATSDRGMFLTSPDAVGWTLQHFMTSLLDINALAWSGSTAVAVGEDGNIWSTTDGVTWSEHAGVTLEYLSDVEWLDNRFVAVGDNGTVLFSTDGVTWSVETTGTTDSLRAVAWSDSAQVYVALGIGASFVSADGVTWAPIVVSGLFEDVTWAGALNLFVAVDTNGSISTSPDGITWTERVDLDQFYSLDTIFADDTQLIAGGDIGEIVTSTDASTWVTRASAADFEQVRWDGTTLYAVGGPSKIATSTDGGVTWSYHRTGYDGDYMHDITSSGTRLLAAAQTYYMSTPPTLDSPWPTHDWIGATTHDLGVVWDGTQFVSVGSNGGMRVSADGLGYTYVASTVTGTSELLRSIVHTGTQYVVVGNTGTILTAPDLATWTSRTSGTSSNLYSVVYSGSTYVAVGGGGTILVSSDGTTWSIATSNTTNTLNTVIWTGNEFVVVGFGTVMTSPDGLAWTPMAESLPANTYKGIAFTGSRLVAVGNDGAIATLDWP